jgi:hypothetical protein
MTQNVHFRRLIRAGITSIVLNAVLMLSAFTPESSLFTKIADAFDALPGVIILRIFAPGHTMPSFVGAMIGALFCSFAFYALVAWGSLELFAYVRQHRARNSTDGGVLKL